MLGQRADYNPTVRGFIRPGIATLLVVPGLAFAASIVGVGHLPGESSRSYAGAVSDDGSVVVGSSDSSEGIQAFRWTSAGGMVGLGGLPGSSFFYSTASGVSSDGTVVVGNAYSSPGFVAFRWTSSEGMADLGGLAGGTGTSIGRIVSSNGAVVAGYAAGAAGTEGFRWTNEGGMVGIGDLEGGNYFSDAIGMSSDGEVLVGASDSAAGRQAFRWTRDTGIVGLGYLPGRDSASTATAVSADGSVVVGYSNGVSGSAAFRWTATGGMVLIGITNEAGSILIPTDTSADGSVSVGVAEAASGDQTAVIWADAGGTEQLIDVLIANGARDVAGWSLIEASGISANGRWVVGYGVNPEGQYEGFLADLAPSGKTGGGGAVDLATIALLFLISIPFWRTFRRHIGSSSAD